MTEDSTLGGYLRRHDRPPAFGGSDGHAYSVGLYVEPVTDAAAAFGGALLFIRWSAGGDRPVGHVETDWLVYGETEREAKRKLLALSLDDVKGWLDRTLSAAQAEPDTA